MQPKVAEGVPVGTAYPRAEMDLSPFLDCLEALISRDRWKLSGSIAVLAYRIVLGDIVKRADTLRNSHE